jgi:hypothetical protein
MGGFGTSSGVQDMQMIPPSTGGKPGGANFGQGGGGIPGKPGGQIGGNVQPAMPQPNPGGNPAWSPSSAETLLQSNMNQAGGNPLNPVPSWYQGNDPYRGVNHPDPLIGIGRVQNRSGRTIRNMNPPMTQTPQAPTTAPGAQQNNNVAG